MQIKPSFLRFVRKYPLSKDYFSLICAYENVVISIALSACCEEGVCGGEGDGIFKTVVFPYGSITSLLHSVDISISRDDEIHSFMEGVYNVYKGIFFWLRIEGDG